LNASAGCSRVIKKLAARAEYESVEIQKRVNSDHLAFFSSPDTDSGPVAGWFSSHFSIDL
jgi:hypothetical protein